MQGVEWCGAGKLIRGVPQLLQKRAPAGQLLPQFVQKTIAKSVVHEKKSEKFAKKKGER